MSAAAPIYLIDAFVSKAGAEQRASAEKRALRAKAALQKKQADERLRQLDIEMDIFSQNKEIAFGDAVSSYARAGVSIGAGSPLMQLANTEANLKNTMAELERKGRKEAELIEAGAAQLEKAARDIDPSMAIAGSILSGVGKAAQSIDWGEVSDTVASAKAKRGGTL